jgi:hypothetical protein
MTYIPNSLEARDIASLVHMQTNLRRHQEEGRWLSRAAKAVAYLTIPGATTSKRLRDCGAPRSALRPSGWRRLPTNRCASSATIISTGIAPMSPP